MAARFVVFLLASVLLLSCSTGVPRDGRYPGDAGNCDSLPLYERLECKERHPPLHDPIDLRK